MTDHKGPEPVTRAPKAPMTRDEMDRLAEMQRLRNMPDKDHICGEGCYLVQWPCAIARLLVTAMTALEERDNARAGIRELIAQKQFVVERLDKYEHRRQWVPDMAEKLYSESGTFGDGIENATITITADDLNRALAAKRDPQTTLHRPEVTDARRFSSDTMLQRLGDVVYSELGTRDPAAVREWICDARLAALRAPEVGDAQLRNSDMAERVWDAIAAADRSAPLDGHKMAKELAALDTEDAFDWKFGGDGDNGEMLAELCDRWLASRSTPEPTALPDDVESLLMEAEAMAYYAAGDLGLAARIRAFVNAHRDNDPWRDSQRFVPTPTGREDAK